MRRHRFHAAHGLEAIDQFVFKTLGALRIVSAATRSIPVVNTPHPA